MRRWKRLEAEFICENNGPLEYDLETGVVVIILVINKKVVWNIVLLILLVSKFHSN